MAVLATAVTLWDGAEVRELSAGQEVPEWAAGRVGAHCLVAESAPDGAEAPAEANSEPGNDVDSDQTDEPAHAPAPEKATDEPAEAPTEALDFTKPASKRGRPRSTAK